MPTDLTSLLGIFTNLLTLAIPVVVALTLLVFFKGIVTFIMKSGDTKGLAEGKSLLLWGVLALFVMISVYGIIQFFYRDIGFGPSIGVPLLPQTYGPAF